MYQSSTMLQKTTVKINKVVLKPVKAKRRTRRMTRIWMRRKALVGTRVVTQMRLLMNIRKMMRHLQLKNSSVHPIRKRNRLVVVAGLTTTSK